VLAAGKGERLRPLTETRPKPLMPIVSETALCRHLRLARQYYDYGEAVIVASYLLDRVKEEAARCAETLGVEVNVVDQGGERGTGHAIAVGLSAASGDETLIVYSDIVASPAAYEAMARAPPPAILAHETPRPWEYGVLAVEEGALKGIIEKPRPGEEPSNLIFAGMIKLSRNHASYFANLAPSPRGELEATDAITAIAGRERVTVVAPGGYWIDIGRPWDLLEANRVVLESETPARVEGEVHETATITGPVFVAQGATIGPHAVVEGPAYIGPGAEVGPHALIRPYTVLAPGARVGHASEAKASILMEHAKAPHFNYVGDSILGEHVNLGAGTITANLRFDKKTIKMTVKGVRVDTGRKKLGAVIGGHAQTGINVSILPGVKIGAHALVFPGCVVARDVASGEVYRCWEPPR